MRGLEATLRKRRGQLPGRRRWRNRSCTTRSAGRGLVVAGGDVGGIGGKRAVRPGLPTAEMLGHRCEIEGHRECGAPCSVARRVGARRRAAWKGSCFDSLRRPVCGLAPGTAPARYRRDARGAARGRARWRTPSRTWARWGRGRRRRPGRPAATTCWPPTVDSNALSRTEPGQAFPPLPRMVEAGRGAGRAGRARRKPGRPSLAFVDLMVGITGSRPRSSPLRRLGPRRRGVRDRPRARRTGCSARTGPARPRRSR